MFQVAAVEPTITLQLFLLQSDFISHAEFMDIAKLNCNSMSFILTM